MKFSILALALAAATASARLVRDEAPPPCSKDSPLPCTCPEGTEFFYLQTWFSWGASAWSVYNLTGNFSDLSWVPQPIKLTIGPDNKVGSYRLTTIHIDVGVFDWFEEITEYSIKDDGSFVWAFELKNVPLEFPDGKGGSFSGEWERFEGRAAGEHQTDVYWSFYGCHSGGTHTFPLFQRYCLNHVNELLEEMGALKGTTTEPYSEIWMGSKPGLPITKPGERPPPSFGNKGGGGGGPQQYHLGHKGVRLGSDL